MARTPAVDQLVCTPRSLPPARMIAAAHKAIEINPQNRAPVEHLTKLLPGFVPTPAHLAVLTSRMWHTGGVHLTVGFLDGCPAALRRRILTHMNAWAKTANVRFVDTRGQAQVRIARTGGDGGGYWSYLGTDILSIPASRQTMNLEAFSMATSDDEFHRVVRHETGHTLGFPHEHMRRALVKLIDAAKAIAYFGATQGWSPEMVRQQVLTPIEESSLWGTPHADPNSIMCYQIAGALTKNGRPIPGGLDIDPSDYAFAAKVYPKHVAALRNGHGAGARTTRAARPTTRAAARRRATATR